MADIPVNSIELEFDARPDGDHYTLSGNIGSIKIVLITPLKKETLLKLENRPGLHEEPKSSKGGVFEKKLNRVNRVRSLGLLKL